MISTFRLKFGRTPGSLPELVNTTPITLFVGPNNSGKSLVLTEIEQYCRTGAKNASASVLDELMFSPIDREAAEKFLTVLKQPPALGEITYADHIIIGSRYGRAQVPWQTLIDNMQDPGNNKHNYCQWFLTHNTLILNGQNRIALVNQQPAGDLQQPAQSSFQMLFRDDAKRHEVRRITFEAFGSYFVLDPTSLGQFRGRLSSRLPATDIEERGLHKEAVDFHCEAPLIEHASDGVKAFTGIVTEVIAGDPKIILIDEPEAFLHPALATKLALEVSKAANTANKRVFVSTHSAAFVMGCIQSGAPVNIIRLTYRKSVATARFLPSHRVLELMRHPLLRSTGVLNGLFYEFVIVAESDADRAFYQEVNERLLQFKPEWGIPNCLFIHAQNVQTIQTVIRPLRELGIPAAAIVDIDVIKNGGQNWTNILTSADVPGPLHESFANVRLKVKNAMEKTGKDMKRDGGLKILADEELESAKYLLEQLRNYGILVVPNGELESWLKDLQASGHGPSWLIEIFEKMGDDPTSAGYIKPADDDVWKFLGLIKDWFMNPNRKGIPA